MIKVVSICLAMLAASIAAAAVQTDFNGDGKADILIGNLISGQRNAWLINGATVTGRHSYGAVAPNTGWSVIGIKDANADRKTDLYWYNSLTGGIATSLVNGSNMSAMIRYGTKAPAEGWVVLGLGDYNGDRRSDFYWYNLYTGHVEVWSINGSSVLQKLLLTTLSPSAGWMPIGLRDLNGDGRCDLFLYSPYTGGLSALLTNGSLATYGSLSVSDGWQPVGLEDFDGDGRADVLVTNIYTGNYSALLITGATIASSVALGVVAPSSGWALAGLADLNADRRTDLLWYNSTSGGVGAWLTGAGTGFQSIGSAAPRTGWYPAALDDYNGDGKSDLLWVNAFNNGATAWLLNGGRVSAAPSYGAIPASSIWTLSVQPW